MKTRILSLSIATFLSASTAQAQAPIDNGAVPQTREGAAIGASDAADTLVRINELESQIRALTGRLEELEYQNNTLAERLEGLQRQMPVAGVGVVPPQPVQGGVVTQPAQLDPTDDVPPIAPSQPNPSQPIPAHPIEPMTDIPANSDAPPSMAANANAPFKRDESTAPKVAGVAEPRSTTARAEYDKAFTFLKEEKYDEAVGALNNFITEYPKEPLAENAMYWLGEAHFAKGDFQSSAVQFLKAYKAYPLGSKAADNLLKLSVSLGNIGKKPEACGTLEKLSQEFPNASAAIKQRSKKEASKLSCG